MQDKTYTFRTGFLEGSFSRPAAVLASATSKQNEKN